MGKFTCDCLNVKIHTRTDLNPVDPAQLGLNSIDCAGDFWNLEIAEASLALEGIRVEQPCLIKESMTCDWLVNTCRNCDMYTHATRVSQGTILVNCGLKSDLTIQEEMEKSSDFSPLFKIKLANQIDNRPVGTLGVHSDKYDALESTLKSIQERLNNYLRAEETAMENRIREFEEQQRATFAELQSKARRDKNNMISLVLSSEQQESGESGNSSPSPYSAQSSQEDMVTSPMTDSDSSNREGNRERRQKVPKSSKSDFSFLKQPNTKASPSVIRPKRFTQAKPLTQDDDDALFDIEGIDDVDDSRPFYNSDDENDTDDSNSLNDESIVPGSGNRGYGGRVSSTRNMYSSSVPISCPSWRQYRNRNGSIDEADDEDDDRVPAPDPENMAASISALARSVHADSAAVFGERPRRKVSAFDKGHR